VTEAPSHASHPSNCARISTGHSITRICLLCKARRYFISPLRSEDIRGKVRPNLCVKRSSAAQKDKQKNNNLSQIADINLRSTRMSEETGNKELKFFCRKVNTERYIKHKIVRNGHNEEYLSLDESIYDIGNTKLKTRLCCRTAPYPLCCFTQLESGNRLRAVTVDVSSVK
jgi:hypothetical protein